MQQSKPGWKTTEAWGVGGVLYWAVDLAQRSDDWQTHVAAIVCATLTVCCYTWQRTRAKDGGY